MNRSFSPVTIAELRFGAEVARDPGVRQKRLAALRRLQRKPLLPLDGGTGDIFGSLAAAIRAAGGTIGIVFRIYGSQVRRFSTAWDFLTRNRRDFEDIPGLDLTIYSVVTQRQG